MLSVHHPLQNHFCHKSRIIFLDSCFINLSIYQQFREPKHSAPQLAKRPLGQQPIAAAEETLLFL